MKRWMLILLTLLAIVLIGGAGYLGMHSVRGQATPTIEAPSTVEVTVGDVQQTVTAPGHLVHGRETVLALEVGGMLAEVTVRPGEFVHAGEVLAQLDPGPFQDKVALAQMELDAARARLEQLQADPSPAKLAAALLAVADAEARLNELAAGPSTAEVSAAEAEVAAAQRDLESLRSLPDPNDIARAQAQLDKARVVLQQAQAAYDLVKDRPEVGMLPQALALQQATIDYEVAETALNAARCGATHVELQAAEARLAAAQARLAQLRAEPSAEELRIAELQKEKAEAELAQLTAGPSAADLQQAERTVQAAELALMRAQADVEAATLRAPHSGVILEVRASQGELVPAGAGFVRVADISVLEVEATVIEEDLPLVQVGQAVELFFDALPEVEVQGHVIRIVPQCLPGDRPLYPVYIAVDELPSGLLAGMTADSSIVVEARYNVLRLPRALVRARSDGTATVQVWTGMGSQERHIQVGLRGDSYIEVLQGLDVGEEVVAQ